MKKEKELNNNNMNFNCLRTRKKMHAGITKFLYFCPLFKQKKLLKGSTNKDEKLCSLFNPFNYNIPFASQLGQCEENR